MSTPIRALLVEDNPCDADLVLLALRRAGLEVEWQRVETEPDYEAALGQSWDIILSDYEMPQFNGLRALEPPEKAQVTAAVHPYLRHHRRGSGGEGDEGWRRGLSAQGPHGPPRPRGGARPAAKPAQP
ncbi:MAG: response regulator [Chthoniobacteraceae bacterium]